jgi:SRSO17 transposase
LFSDRYRHFFKTRGHDNVDVALRYLRGLTQAEARTFEGIADVVEGGDAQQLQHFISNSPWDHQPVMAQVARDANALLGGGPQSALIIDETSFLKQGARSVGVSRQWSGRAGKVENCQNAVVVVLTDGARFTPVGTRLYLPTKWTEDPARCRRAGVPASDMTFKAKSELALDLVREARLRGLEFNHVGADGGYGKEPAFLRALEDDGETFMVDVHGDQAVWLEDPKPSVPGRSSNRGRAPTKRKTAAKSVEVRKLAERLPSDAWTRFVLRESTRGPLHVEIAHVGVWAWDGEEAEARRWNLVIRREVESPKTIKYGFSNAPADTPILTLAQMQGNRYWVERAFEDAKGACGMADYQLLGWRAWHHHITFVMLAMLFIAEQRMVERSGLELLSPNDIVEILKETLPRKPEGKAALIVRITERHKKRQSSIDSRYKSHQRKYGPPSIDLADASNENSESG